MGTPTPPTSSPTTEPHGLTAGPRRALLRWWARHRRDLPWRHTRDPWAVLVSEVMLQQTQVDRVAPRWEQFMARFPDPTAAVAAGVGAVLDEWAGLGYNRRAVTLHAAAVACVEHHQGQVPTDMDGLLALPGVGPYTARAVLAFAYHQDVAVVDTNVGRILARVAGRRLRPTEAQAMADGSVPPGDGWEWNQAVLDFGSAVCTARNPRCVECPLRRWCSWVGGPDEDPARGSAGVTTRQSRFEGSDRQGRGRLVDALRNVAAIDAGDLPGVAGWPDDPERSRRVADGLVADGLALPGAEGGLRRAD